MRGDLEQRRQHERAFVHFRVWQDETPTLGLVLGPVPVLTSVLGPANPPAAVVEDIDVEAARSPARAQPATCPPLDLLDKAQQGCGRYRRV